MLLGPYRFGLPSVSPASLFIGGRQGAWYDPSDLTTLFQDSAGTTPVTASGQPVGRMLDKSGNGNHMIQATTAKRPTYIVNGSGKSLLRFGGAHSMYTAAVVPMSATDELSIFGGMHWPTDTVAVMYESSVDSNYNNGSAFVVTGNNGITGVTVVTKGTATMVAIEQVARIALPAPQTGFFSAVSDISDSSSKLRFNRNLGLDATGSKGTGNFLNYVHYLGARANSGLYFNGDLYSLIAVGKKSTNAEVIAMESWVEGKMGLSVVPQIGSYWLGEGGYYAGTITYADARQFRIILADVATTSSLQWKNVNTDTVGTDSEDDGFACTAAMIADSPANHPAADYCNSLVSDSKTDWYIPSKNEMALLMANLRTTAPGVHANFASGGAQAFTTEGSYYHTSTQASGVGPQYNWQFRFSTNGSTAGGKNDTRPVRAIRRIPV